MLCNKMKVWALKLLDNIRRRGMQRIKIFFFSRDINNKDYFHKCHDALGTVIGSSVRMGKNVKVYHSCTIGGKNNANPIIEDNVTIYPHCIIVGDITIGKNTIIGAGTFVDKDIPANSLVYNKKELIIKQKD